MWWAGGHCFVFFWISKNRITQVEIQHLFPSVRVTKYSKSLYAQSLMQHKIIHKQALNSKWAVTVQNVFIWAWQILHVNPELLHDPSILGGTSFLRHLTFVQLRRVWLFIARLAPVFGSLCQIIWLFKILGFWKKCFSCHYILITLKLQEVSV